MRSFVAMLFIVSCAPAHREAAPPHESIDAAAPNEINTANTQTSAAAEDTTAADAGPEVSSACPTSFKSGGGLCGTSGAKCEYPEGTCTCAPSHYCGGAAPPPEVLKAHAVPRWNCEPSPKVLGPDGCPLGDPSGHACATPGKQCHYMPCCAITVTCTGGKWVPGSPNCPP